MSNRVLDFHSYINNISESSTETYSIDQISDALDSVESSIPEYFKVDADDAKLDYSQSGDNVEIYPDISKDHKDYSYDYDSSLSREVIRNLDSSDDGKRPRFTKDDIKDAIDTISSNSDYYISGVDVSSASVDVSVDMHSDDEIRVSAEMDNKDGDIVVDDFDFSSWKSDILEEILRSIPRKIYLQ